MLFKNTTEKAVDSVGTIVGEGTKSIGDYLKLMKREW